MPGMVLYTIFERFPHRFRVFPQPVKRLYENDDSRGVIREHEEKLRDILARLDAAGTIADMDMPAFRPHPLKGEHKGFWAVTVRANWRVIFRFAGADVLDVDYLDYH